MSPSPGQYRLLRGVLYPQILRELRKMAAEVGEECPFKSEDDLHEATLYLARIKSTKDLTGSQFDALVEFTVAYWSRRGIPVELNS